MHQRCYCEGDIAIEMKNKILSLFFNYDANLKSVITMELKFFFFAMLISQYDVISCDVINVKTFREILRYYDPDIYTTIYILRL